jgi:hypothetical protein
MRAHLPQGELVEMRVNISEFEGYFAPADEMKPKVRCAQW